MRPSAINAADGMPGETARDELITKSGLLPPLAETMLPRTSLTKVSRLKDCHDTNASPFGNATTVGASLLSPSGTVLTRKSEPIGVPSASRNRPRTFQRSSLRFSVDIQVTRIRPSARTV
jgi:hypothetical protein